MSAEINQIIQLLFSCLYMIIMARFILSWVPSAPGDAIYDLTVLVYEITDPLCVPFQRLIPSIGGLDFSLIFVLFGIQVFENIVLSSLGVR